MKNAFMNDLVRWAFHNQRVDRQGLTLQERLENGLGRPAAGFRQGDRVDGTLHGLGKVHPDAETIHDAVCRLDGMVNGLVAQYARIVEQPDWVPGAVIVERYARDEKGAPIRVKDFNGRFIGYRRERVVTVNGEEIGMCEDGLRLARDVWELWARAMITLCETVGPLITYRVIGPGVELRPWEGEGKAAA